MFTQLLTRAIFGPGQYLKQSDLKTMTSRHPFSAFLNYLAYDSGHGTLPQPGLQPGHAVGVLAGHLCRSQDRHLPWKVCSGPGCRRAASFN